MTRKELSRDLLSLEEQMSESRIFADDTDFADYLAGGGEWKIWKGEKIPLYRLLTADR